MYKTTPISSAWLQLTELDSKGKGYKKANFRSFQLFSLNSCCPKLNVLPLEVWIPHCATCPASRTSVFNCHQRYTLQCTLCCHTYQRIERVLCANNKIICHLGPWSVFLTSVGKFDPHFQKHSLWEFLPYPWFLWISCLPTFRTPCFCYHAHKCFLSLVLS